MKSTFAVVDEDQCFARTYPQALREVVKEGSVDDNCVIANMVGRDEEHRHGKRLGDEWLLLKQGFYPIEKSVSICIQLHPAFFGEFGEEVFLFRREFRGDLDFDPNQLVTGLMVFETCDPLSFDAKRLVLLRAGRDFDNTGPFQRGDLDFATQDGGDEIDRDIAGDIVSRTGEEVMRLHAHGDEQVAWRTTVDPMFPFIGQA